MSKGFYIVGIFIVTIICFWFGEYIGNKYLNKGSNISNNTETIRVLRELLSKRDAEIQAVRTELESAKGTIGTLTNRIERYKTSITAISIRLEKYENRIEDSDNRLGIVQGRFKESEILNRELRAIIETGSRETTSFGAILKEIRERGPIEIK